MLSRLLLACPSEEFEGQVTIALRVLVEVVLVIVFGGEEIAQWQEFYGERLPQGILHLLEHGLDGRAQRGVGIVYAGAVLRAFVVPLSVDAEGVDGVKEHSRQEFHVGHVGVKDDAHSLGKACLVGANFFVSGAAVSLSVSIAHLGFQYACHLLEIVFSPPKAAAGKIDFLRGHRFVDYRTVLYLLCLKNLSRRKVADRGGLSPR